MNSNKNKNRMIGILILIVLFVIAFFVYTSTQKVQMTAGIIDIGSDTDFNDQEPPTYAPPQVPLNESTSYDAEIASSENYEGPLYIKSIYQKDGKWMADVDYVSITPREEFYKRNIENGLCGIYEFNNTSELLRTFENFLSNNNGILPSGFSYLMLPTSDLKSCLSEVADHEWSFYYKNQNSKIRSLQFSETYKTLNYCPEDESPNPLELKQRLSDYEYIYRIYNTNGFFIRKAIIVNGEVSVFDFINSCAG